jgi:hypothetical protein
MPEVVLAKRSTAFFSNLMVFNKVIFSEVTISLTGLEKAKNLVFHVHLFLSLRSLGVLTFKHNIIKNNPFFLTGKN